MKKTREKEEKVKEPVSIRPLLQWTLSLLYCVDWLGFRVGNIGRHYIPELLMDSGLPVHIASTVVAISVVVGSPHDLFSDRFMDHWPLRVLISSSN